LAALARSEYKNALDALTEGLEDLGTLTNSLPGAMAINLLLDAEGSPWTEDRLRERMAVYRPGHGVFRLDPEGRALRHTEVNRSPDGDNPSPEFWEVRQMLQDHEGHNDWAVVFSVDINSSRLVRIPVLKLSRMGEMQPGT
jgi:hypothetical protein